MHKGQLFQLNQDTLAVRAPDGTKGFVTVPAGDCVQISADRGQRRFVEVLWHGEALLMFATDIKERGIERLGTRGASN